VVKSRLGIGETILTNYVSRLQEDKGEIARLMAVGTRTDFTEEDETMHSDPKAY
jgi:hypothetical protein